MSRDGSGNEPVVMGVVTLQRITEKAILVFTSKQREVWIPQAAVHDDSEICGRDDTGRQQRTGQAGKLILKRWFTDKQGWSK